MLRNYLKMAWRNLLKYSTFSFINITGLSIGIAACMIIFLYVHHEMTFDQYNAKSDRICRVTTTLHTPESEMAFATSPAPLAGALKRDFPEIESIVRLEPSPKVVKLQDDFFREDAFYTADQSVFSIFSFDFIEGSAANALQNPHSIVISRTIAKKYFSQSAAHSQSAASDGPFGLGKMMRCNNEDYLITGVFEDRPSNSDIRIDALLSTDFSKITSWMDDFSVYTFILFKRKQDLRLFGPKLASAGKYAQAELDAQGATKYNVRFELEPLSTVHFSQGKLVDTPKGNKQFNFVFSLLALFILIIALLNYINLSTAKSTERAKEVGIRKVSGASHFQLMRQFLFESFFIVAIAWILSIVLLQIGVPFFNRLFDTKLAINWTQWILFMAGIFIVTFLLAGLYPAFVMSSFKPVKVLKGNWRQGKTGIFLRKTVTISQFAIATALIMGTTVIYKQMKFIETKDLGFNKDQLLNIYLPKDSSSLHMVKAFQDALHQRPEIKGLTIGNGMTQDGISMASTNVESEGKKRELMFNYYFIDPDFLPLFQIRLLEGRNLSDSFSTDKNEGFLVNEAFVKNLGWKSGIGQEIDGFGRHGKILGVVKNFYYKSLHNMVEPLVMIYNTFPANTTTVKIMPGDLPIVKAIFKKNFPALPFEYSFFDEMVNKQYKIDRVTMTLFNDFTILSILISCLGLYGLVTLISMQRTKEMGIRKVLGASVGELLSLMTRDFMKLVFLSFVIALPFAGMAMQKWLGSYAYHFQLSWWVFLVPVIILPIIAILVISREIFRSAQVNPVDSLRME
ncbi:MAG: ABC transporter permease [Chitinophagales bacterium]